jgi:RimJ/RimL family protein N-acetyltransferase
MTILAAVPLAASPASVGAVAAEHGPDQVGGVIRRLGKGERDRLLEHLLRLGSEDRHLRFGGHAGDERIRAYCAGLDWSRSVVLGCLVAGELRAAGELKLIDEIRSCTAEITVSVEVPFRGRGVGTELCRRLAVRARNRFVKKIHMLCLLDNRRVQRIARRLGGALVFYPGEVEAEIGLPWPEPLSMAEEWLDEAPALPWLWP